MTKSCKVCRAEMPLSEFHRAAKNKDGHNTTCKRCRAMEEHANRPLRREYYRQRSARPDVKAKKAAYQKSAAGLAVNRRATAKYATTPRGRARACKVAASMRAKYPEKVVARNAVTHAKEKGLLVPQPCEACGATENIHAHHEDYRRPLNVRWLCVQCHRAEHRAAA